MVGSDMASQNVCVVWGGFLKGKCFRVDVMQLGFLDCKDRMVGGGFRMNVMNDENESVWLLWESNLLQVRLLLGSLPLSEIFQA